MAKELKFLYETKVNKQTTEETRTKDEKDPAIEVVKKVKKLQPVKIAVLKPTRRLFEAAEIFYAKKIADYLRDGLLPLSLVAKRYANDGGAVSEPEKAVIDELRKEVKKSQEEYFSLGSTDLSKEASEKRKFLLGKISDLNSELNTFQNAYSDIFENTAEMKARNKTMDWWVLHLCYIEGDKGTYVPVFGDGSYEEKYNAYEEKLDDDNDPFTLEVINLSSYLIGYWLTARGTLSKEELNTLEFNVMEKLYLDTVSTYKTEETAPLPAPVAKVVEPPAGTPTI